MPDRGQTEVGEELEIRAITGVDAERRIKQNNQIDLYRRILRV